MNMAPQQASKLVLLLLSLYLLVLNFSFIPVHALNIGIQASPSSSLSTNCSRKCESQFCIVAPIPFLRYGKYCGLLYTGCPKEKPCDGLDSCCKNHDDCIGAKNNDYLSTQCSQDFLDCVATFRRSGGKGFKGSTCSVDEVAIVTTTVVEAALLAGRYLNRP